MSTEERSEKGPAQLHPASVLDYCFAQWGMYLVGPMKTTESSMACIIVLSGCMMRWAEAKAIPNKCAASVCLVMVECVISQFGCTEVIITDQGREFVNALNLQLCIKLDINHCIRSACHPQMNGLAERLSRTLVSQLRKMVDSSHSDWDTLLPWILMSYRTNTQVSSKNAPFFGMWSANGSAS